MRRTRIKGIASIPQRKKDATVTHQKNEDDLKSDEDKFKDETHKKQESQITIKDPRISPQRKEVISTDSEIDHKSAESNLTILSNIVLTPKIKTVHDIKTNDLDNTAKINTHAHDTTTNGLKNINSSKNELILPPSSPNKVNRTRIKAIPRFGNRKISFSASESEDEVKKGNSRTRHDSQSSNVSMVPELVSEQTSIPKVKEFSSVIQKKCKRTEWSRKLAEARREFTRKYVCGKPPDHKKLTMIDLIFYNPSTNAIKKSHGKTRSSSTVEEEEDLDDLSEKDPDDPPEPECEENDIPAPQIKIGPSGEIVLDEKSLLIESRETKKNRANLERSKIVDGNSDQRPYGVYKKVKRSKDWSHSETVRFYRALSTVGTDFSLMCELFPTRTRRELKMKFKKEERVNHVLVDKAMMQPCDFDFDTLKKEFELIEIERKEIEKQKQHQEKLKRNKENKSSAKFSNVIENNKNNCHSDSSSNESDKIQLKTVRATYRKKIEDHFASDEEDGEDEPNITHKKKHKTNDETVEQNLNSESIVILPSTSSENGNSVQIFMVTDDETGPNTLLKIGTIEAKTIESKDKNEINIQESDVSKNET